MTLFSLIALAFGMMAAAADGAVPRTSFASISVQRGPRRAERRAFPGVASARGITRDRNQPRPQFRTSPLRRIIAPLTGAATPRAPEPAV